MQGMRFSRIEDDFLYYSIANLLQWRRCRDELSAHALSAQDNVACVLPLRAPSQCLMCKLFCAVVLQIPGGSGAGQI